MDKKKLFVGSLPWSVTTDTLKELFASYGEIVDAVVISDRMSGRSKGFGFVTFSNEADAEKAQAEMNEKDVEGRKLIVNFAKPREERSDFRRPNTRGNFQRGGRH